METPGGASGRRAPSWPDLLVQIQRREDLDDATASAAMTRIMEGEVSPLNVAALLMGLRVKGETAEEVTGFVRTMRRFALPVRVDGPLVDTCGTGGDRKGTFNVSTAAAFVVAGAGARVCKHGNRAASSQCGSADVLEELGVVIDLGPEGVARCIKEAGIGFCLAQRFHPAFRFAATARTELGIPTTFNFLGPLANPAGAKHQALGVSDPEMAERVARTLRELGSEGAVVFYGHDGLDELTTTTTSTVFELEADGHIDDYEFDPEDYDIPRAELADLIGGDAATNARIVRRVLDGERGPHRDIVVLNAAAGLVAGDAAVNFDGAIESAAAAIDDGLAGERLEALVEVSRAGAGG